MLDLEGIKTLLIQVEKNQGYFTTYNLPKLHNPYANLGLERSGQQHRADSNILSFYDRKAGNERSTIEEPGRQLGFVRREKVANQ